MKEKHRLLLTYCYRLFAITMLTMALISKANSQTEMQPWGNITGIRVGGQLMELETSLQVVSNDWSKVNATALERQRPKYTRNGDTQIVTTRIDSFYFVEKVTEDIRNNLAKVAVQFNARKSTDSTRLFFNIKLPESGYANGSIALINPQGKEDKKYSIADLNDNKELTANGIRFISPQQQLEIKLNSTLPVIINKGQLFIPLQQGSIQNDQTGQLALTIKASGTVDKSPATLQLNTSDTGSMFAGFGGNFRLQNPKTDPQVIDYCLDNMRVAWGRVEMPFQLWQPDKDSNPIDSAKAGKLHPHVKESMEMAARLGKMGTPVILTAWSAPRWAITGDISNGPRPNGVWGNPLDTTNMQAIYKSIADYITYLRDAYGVEVKMFSFNESDLGINVRQTGEEHAALIKGLGAYLQSRGLHTKMLLGDNSDATTYTFIYPAMQDPATHPYIGAISFHSWRGWSTDLLQKWRDAATQMHLPLLVGEGSIDAAAWDYPAIFQEQTYAIKEINLYTRLLAICQPLSILQWQLTADYSPLIGGGIFGNNEPLHPGQRFWNLKQLASVPKDIYALPVTVDKPYISCAAQGDNSKGKYAIHIVNDGATRTATIKGLPATIKQLTAYTTSKSMNMQKSSVSVTNGQAKLTLNTESYTTLISE